jgi:SPP1 gp7 family putative phage head morphogenesis protein
MPSPQIDPLALSRDYLSLLLKYNRAIGAAIAKVFTRERIEALLAGKTVRLDAEGDPLSSAVASIQRLASARKPSEDETHKVISRFAVNITRTGASNFRTKVTQSRLPAKAKQAAIDAAYPTVNVLANDKLRRRVLKTLRENVKLIKGLEDETYARLNRTFQRAIRKGWSPERLEKTLQSRWYRDGDGPIFSESRARLIVRDQTLKLEQAIQREQFEEAGLSYYIWRTVGDDRVRPTHQNNDGRVFSWAKPSPITGHPGHDINCRCSPEIIIPGILIPHK